MTLSEYGQRSPGDNNSMRFPSNLINEGLLNVLSSALNNPNHHFFGVTGDIDDLGVFVAQHGRAHAENLVDFVSVITENYFLNWKEKSISTISSFVFIPGGEEMLLLGTCKNEQPLREMFVGCRQGVNQEVKSYDFFPVDDIAVSFGCAIFRREDLTPRIRRLLNGYVDRATTYRAYLEVMYLLRRVLSVCLDLEKFRMFENSRPELAIAYRNLVHFDLLRHKDRSRNLIALAARNLQLPQYLELLKYVCDDYGMLNSRMQATASLVEALEWNNRPE